MGCPCSQMRFPPLGKMHVVRVNIGQHKIVGNENVNEGREVTNGGAMDKIVYEVWERKELSQPLVGLGARLSGHKVLHCCTEWSQGQVPKAGQMATITTQVVEMASVVGKRVST